MARKPKVLPVLTPDGVIEEYPSIRQSRLGDFDNCSLMTKWTLEGYDFTNKPQARGIVFHRFAAEVLRTLRRQGLSMLPVDEALTILYEVCAQREVPDEEVVVLPAAERRLLRICAIKFAHENEFNMTRLIDVERRLYATITYPQPETGVAVERRITGTPDAIVADPPDGAVVLDWKTTLQPPPRYGGQQDDTDSGVSYMGYFQQRFYALLVFANYSAVQKVTLREFYPLAGEARTATVHRHQLEHIEREMAAQVELLDRALAGGADSKMWKPSPGRHCTYCPRPTACPIEADVRVFGAGGGDVAGITSRAHAERLAAEYVLAGRVKDVLHNALKGHVEVFGPIPVKSAKGRYEVRWKKTNAGNRFGVHVPAESTRGPKDEDLEAAFLEAAERRKR